MSKVYCPNCKKESSDKAKNPAWPFCSDRCKLIDLGAWASEAYKVPTEEHILHSQDHESE